MPEQAVASHAGTLPLTSTHWGSYRVETSNGRVVRVHPFEADPAPSPIGQNMVGLPDLPARITRPAVRQGWLRDGPAASDRTRRGTDPFVEVDWDEAATLVARELERIANSHGNQAIFGGSYGWASAGRFHHAQSQLHRFLNCIGGYTQSLNTYSFAAAEVIVPHILGDFRGFLVNSTSWKSIASHGRLVVAFGGVPLRNAQVNTGGLGAHSQNHGVRAAANAGVHFVGISPVRSDLDGIPDAEWWPVRPGSDVAVMLAMAQVLVEENLVDHDFIARYSVGYDHFRAYLSGCNDSICKSPEWAEPITDLPAEDIRELARRMARERTMLSVSWSLTRQDHGEQPYWAAIALAAMLGHIGLDGGGITFGLAALNAIGADFTALPLAALPQGRNPINTFVPVARIADALLSPGAAFTYNGGHYRYPDLRCLYWAGGNPFHHHQDLNRLLRAWAMPETIIIHDWCWTATARRADIVLPCTTALERSDLGCAARDGYLLAMEQVIPPYADARNDYDIFATIAERMGCLSAFTEGRDAAEWQQWLYQQTRTCCRARGILLPEYEAFLRLGWFEVAPPEPPMVMLRDFRNNPDAHPLGTPSGRIEMFSSTIADFALPDCPGHPVWLEPREWLGNVTSPFPLHLVSSQPAARLHSQFDQGAHSQASKHKGREPLRIHPEDAAGRGIAEGAGVRVFNDRGSCLTVATLDDSLRRSVVQMSVGAWFDPENMSTVNSPCKHGNPNVLTRDEGTSGLAQGPSAMSCLVEVEQYSGELPPVTAFDLPPMADSSGLD